MAEWSARQTQSSSPEFGFHFDHYLDLSHGSPKFKSSATLVNSQLVCPWPVAQDSEQCYVQFDLFVSIVCSAPLAFVL